MKPHMIQPNHSVASPSHHVFLDCESVPELLPGLQKTRKEHFRLFCASAVQMVRGEPKRRATAEGVTKEAFWDFLWSKTSIHHPVWVWAHNAPVDWAWIGLFERLDRGELEYKFGVFESPPNILSVRWRGREIRFLDSLNWFKSSLRDLGQSIGLEKLPFPDRSESNEVWFRYCRRDVEVMEKAIIALVRFVRENDLGQFRSTVASQSWHSWRHLWEGPFYFVHANPFISALERRGYYGGRCAVFYRGRIVDRDTSLGEQRQHRDDGNPILPNTPVHVYDATGFYPSLLRGRQYPRALAYHLSECSVDGLWNTLREHAAIADVRVRTDRDVYPVRRMNGTVYARGDFWTTLAGPELQHAILSGHVRKVGDVAVYETADMFTKWVDKLWEIRERFTQEEQPVWKEMAKVLINALPGKIGQTDGGWKDWKLPPIRQRWGRFFRWDNEQDKLVECRAIAGNYQVRLTPGEGEHSFVSIPAYLTSFGRDLMREIISLIPERHIFYHDTDSLHVDNVGRDYLDRAGLLNREGIGRLVWKSSHSDVEYRNAKVYRFGDEYKVSGVRKSVRAEKPWSWETDRWESFDQMINREPDGTVQIWSLVSEVSRKFDCAIAGEDGFTSPVTINDPESLPKDLTRRQDRE